MEGGVEPPTRLEGKRFGACRITHCGACVVLVLVVALVREISALVRSSPLTSLLDLLEDESRSEP